MFSCVRRGTMSRSWVVTGAPCATAASAPTTTNSTPFAASVLGRLSSETDTQFLELSQRAIVLLDPLLRGHGEHRVDQRGVDIVRHDHDPSTLVVFAGDGIFD